MSARRRAAALLPLIPLLGACAGDEPAGEPPAACDVVFLSLDTVRADVLTFADPEVAPNLTALAERGVVFEQAIAGSSWTLPSHAEMFTGLPPILHGVHDDGLAIDPEHPTLGELMDARGCHTAGVWSGWYLAGAYGFARGFDRWTSALAPDLSADRRLGADLEAGGSAAYWAGDVRGAASHRDVSSRRVVAAARAALAETRPGEPLLLFAHFFDPHYDFIPPAPYDEKFDPDYGGEIDGRDYFANPRIYDPRRDPPRVVGDRDLEHLRALYTGEVAWCDAAIGELLGALEAAGRLERALIVVTADHGEEFFEHENRGHRQTLYDEVLRVPLLVVPPVPEGGPDPARRGTRAGEQVALCDLLPTILDYAGGDVPRTVWGRSLRPRIEGRALAPRPVVCSLGQEAPSRGGRALRLLEAVRTPDEKLVRRVRLDPRGRASEVESIEWFDLGVDPGELRAPSTNDAARLRERWEAVEEVFAELRAFDERLPRSPPAERRTTVREVFADQLGPLGYGGDSPEPGSEGARWPEGPLERLPWSPGALAGPR